jgi:hypothetical protein
MPAPVSAPLLSGTEKTKSGIGNVAGDGFGEKSIGLLGGLSLLWNNITGPAMVALAGVYMNAGWLPATVLLAFVGIMSGFGGGFLIEAMARMPGNAEFEERMVRVASARHLRNSTVQCTAADPSDCRRRLLHPPRLLLLLATAAAPASRHVRHVLCCRCGCRR